MPSDGKKGLNKWRKAGYRSTSTRNSSTRFSIAPLPIYSAGVKSLTTLAANRALAYAKASAPVETGAYRDGLGIEEVKREHRTTVMVVGHDPKTLLVEAQTGNLAKALKKARV